MHLVVVLECADLVLVLHLIVFEGKRLVLHHVFQLFQESDGPKHFALAIYARQVVRNVVFIPLCLF